MTTIIHVPQEFNNKRYLITGNEANEMIAFCLPRIRSSSQSFYKREIMQDLIKSRTSIIDSHAGMGNFYIIKLDAEGQLKIF